MEDDPGDVSIFVYKRDWKQEFSDWLSLVPPKGVRQDNYWCRICSASIRPKKHNVLLHVSSNKHLSATGIIDPPSVRPWQHEHILQLINLYKSHAILYSNVKRNAKNNLAKREALESIMLDINFIRKGTKLHDVKAKIENLKYYFLKEYKRVVASGQAYVPRFLYFKELMFLRHLFWDNNNLMKVVIPNEREEEGECELELDASEAALPQQNKPANSGGTLQIRSKKIKRQHSSVVATQTPRPSNYGTLPSDHGNSEAVVDTSYEIFANYISSEMRELPANLLVDVKSKIINVLIDAEEEKEALESAVLTVNEGNELVLL